MVTTRSSADADNRRDAFSGHSRSTNILGPLRLTDDSDAIAELHMHDSMLYHHPINKQS